MNTQPLLAIIGPTASGKTPLALVVAGLINGEIVSADSRQIYRQLNIGTAKPSSDERRRIRHHFIDILDPDEEYSAGQYGSDVKRVIAEVSGRGKAPILVGGSGLYVKAAIDGMFTGPGKDPEVRDQLEERLRVLGIEDLREEVGRVDPRALGNMKEVTPRRLIRALEVFYVTGKPISVFHEEQTRTTVRQTIQISLSWDRQALYRRIDARVDSMVLEGLVDEVKGLRDRGYGRHLNALNSVGYKEVFDYLEGASDRGTMIDLIKRNTRRFAKRQLTWFSADKRIRKYPMSDFAELHTVAKNIAGAYLRFAEE